MSLILSAGLASAQEQKANDTPQPPDGSKEAIEAKLNAARQTAEDAKAKAAAAAAAAAQQGAGRGRPTPGQPGGTGAPAPARTPGQPVPGLNVEGGNRAGNSASRAPVGPDEVRLDAFSDAVELKTLVEYVAEALQINVSADDTLVGSIVLIAPVTVKKAELLNLLSSLLDQHNFMITKDNTGWYRVVPNTNTPFNMDEGELATTRVIPTPTVKPSSLTLAINEQVSAAAAGQPGPQRITYMDDLGVIIATAAPRRLDALEGLVRRILARNTELIFKRFDLTHVAPAVARQRVLELIGQASQTGQFPVVVQPGQQNQQGLLSQPVTNITNIADRLSVDQASSALFFRGYEAEHARVAELLALIDLPTSLKYKQYYAGSGATQIAQLAERLGLGQFVPVEAGAQSPAATNPAQPNFQQNQGGQRNQQQLSLQAQQQVAAIGGPVMIVDTIRNTIIYYGTQSQQGQLADLISKFDTELEQVVIMNYKLKNRPAADIADVLNGVAFNQQAAGGSEFLPGQAGFFGQLNRQFGQGGGFQTQGFNNNQTNTGRNTNSRTGSGSTRNNQNRTNQRGGLTQPNRSFAPGSAQSALTEGTDPLGGPDVFILADTANNQVIVKAPARQQEEFAKLIAKLDQRSPQVYIEVQIVAVTATNDFRLAFESQLIAGQFAMNTNFGLGSLTTAGSGTTPGTGSFTSRKNVATGLGGFTSAIIKSNYVPFVMTALAENTDSRILASPHLLVDDNVEAEIISVEEQPTSGSTINASTTSNTFTGYEQAGTRLLVTPSISEGGYMRLMYEIELSNFIGQGANGAPPPKQTRNVRSDSVTVPGDTTIIVGGITLDAKDKTIAKIPLLGDIPLLGHLFRDTGISSSNTRLYVFITPRIFRDTNFRDSLLLTMGPRAEAGIGADFPELKPAMIELIGGEPAPARPDKGTN